MQKADNGRKTTPAKEPSLIFTMGGYNQFEQFELLFYKAAVVLDVCK